MGMQANGEAAMDMSGFSSRPVVACGGAARRLDAAKLSAVRRRRVAADGGGACAATDVPARTAVKAPARTAAKAPSALIPGPLASEPADSALGQDSASGFDPDEDVRRRSLRRRVLFVLAVSFAATALVCWEYLPGLLAWLADPAAVRAFVADHAVTSRLAMFAINVTQVFLAFLPGEPVELASGYAFGFWEGAALCLVASGFASSIIYWATRKWGWSLVGLFFDRSMFSRFSWLNNAKRLEIVMLALFLIPGTPKDFLTYFAGLTSMRFMPVVFIATLGRIPSIVTSTIAASAVGAGNWPLVVCTLVVSALLLAAGGLMYRRLRGRER